jgi:hypothetical protein
MVTKVHPLKGTHQTPEQIQKRVEATRLNRLTWSPEKWQHWHDGVVKHLTYNNPEALEKMRQSKIGNVPWNKGEVGCMPIPYNKGNNWRDNYTPEEVREIIAKRARDFRKRSVRQRINESMGAMVYQALKENKKGRKWESFVGYTLDDLMKHLENQFKDGMSWDNKGEWHIDHIIPRSHFHFTSPEDSEFKECWALTNLQPLWAEDNLRKAYKFIPNLVKVGQ